MYEIVLKAPNSLNGLFISDTTSEWNIIPDIKLWLKEKLDPKTYEHKIVYNDDLPDDVAKSNCAHAKGL